MTLEQHIFSTCTCFNYFYIWLYGFDAGKEGTNSESRRSFIFGAVFGMSNFFRREVDELQKRVLFEREQYQASSANSNRISAIPKFSVNDKFFLSKEDGCYQLSIEVQMAIDNVLIQVIKCSLFSIYISLVTLLPWLPSKVQVLCVVVVEGGGLRKSSAPVETYTNGWFLAVQIHNWR